MPIVQFTSVSAGRTRLPSTSPSPSAPVRKYFPIPRKVGEIYKGWYKAARVALPEIPPIMELGIGVEPDLYGRLWRLASEPVVTIDWIRFDLENDIGEKGTVLIQRRGDPTGVAL